MDSELTQQLNKELNEVYYYLLKLGTPREDAQDLVQETAYKYLMYFDSIHTGKIKSWLIRVAINLHHDHYRKNKRLQNGLETEKLEAMVEELPENILLSREKRQEIETILQKLKPVYKELLLLKYEYEMKYEEIASIMDMKLGTVKTSLYRARKKFVEAYRRSVK